MDPVTSATQQSAGDPSLPSLSLWPYSGTSWPAGSDSLPLVGTFPMVLATCVPPPPLGGPGLRLEALTVLPGQPVGAGSYLARAAWGLHSPLQPLVYWAPASFRTLLVLSTPLTSNTSGKLSLYLQMRQGAPRDPYSTLGHQPPHLMLARAFTPQPAPLQRMPKKSYE